MRNPLLLGARVLALLAAFVATSMVAGVTASGLLIPAVGATDQVSSGTVEFFDSLPTQLDQPQLSEKSVMYASDGRIIAQFYDENRIPVSIDQMSPLIRQAIVAVEDNRFYQHRGVDTRGLMRAAVYNAMHPGEGVQGASTLTMQYVRNLLIEQAYAQGDTQGIDDARKVENSRKIREMKLAVALEKKYDKSTILEGYLNIANFGDNVFGVEAASRYYFNGKHASQLTLSEAATLAGTVQSPSQKNPRKNPKAAQDRRNLVLERMFTQHMITEDQYKKAAATPLVKELKIQRTLNGCANADNRHMSYFCEYVREQIVQDPAFAALGKSEKDRMNAINRGGLTIQTSLDPKLQQAAWDALNGHIPYNDKSKIATATVTVQPGTGKVLTMIQNRRYRVDGSVGSTTLNYAVDKQYGKSNGFQTGSTFKPFTLATWLADGRSAMDVVNASDFSKSFREFTSCGKKLKSRETYEYSNSEGDEKGNMTVASATARSVNSAYIDMESQLDLCDIAQTAESLGVHTVFPTDDCYTKVKSTKLPTCVPSLTLGVKEIAPITMAAAYAAFANDGQFCQPLSILSIRSRSVDGKPGKFVPIPKQNCRQAIEPDVAHGVAWVMQKTLQPGGTAAGKALPGGRPAGGKTGTTNRDIDTWFVGYTRQLATAVWVGDPNTYKGARKPLKNRRIKGKFYDSIFGTDMAAPIWKEIMTAGSKGMDMEPFPNPPAEMIRGSAVGIPDVKGMDEGVARDLLVSAGFQVQVAGGRVNSDQPDGKVAFTQPGAGAQVGPDTTITLFISNGQGGFTLPGFPGLPGQGDNNGNGGGGGGGPGNGGGGGGPGNG